VQRRSFIVRSAAVAAIVAAARAAGSASLLRAGGIAGVTLIARPDRAWLVGTPGGCASRHPRTRRDRLAGGYTVHDLSA
jgi:hypothetical protein